MEVNEKWFIDAMNILMECNRKIGEKDKGKKLTIRHAVATIALHHAHLHLCGLPSTRKSYISEVCGKKGWPVRKRNRELYG